jgi:hydrogenase-4 component F
MGVTVLAVVQGVPSAEAEASVYQDNAGTIVPVLLFMACVVFLGLCVPAPLDSLLQQAAAVLEGKS